MCEAEDQLVISAFGKDVHCSVGGVMIYMFFLMWCFLGVAIIADIFMASIETITSKEETVKQQVHKEVGSTEIVEREFTVKVWNGTVANLTLMALGSSAPEILLSVIEVTSNDFYSGDLGPSTIVGSAAFNLFIIIAVCVVALPEGEERKIADLKVFAITAVFSVVSYLWLLIILVAWTPDIVTIEEAAITFLMFPLLVGLAYTADARMWCFADEKGEHTSKLLEVLGPDGKPLDVKVLKELAQSVIDKYGDDHTPEQNAQMMKVEAHRQRKRSRAYYRVQATRSLTGGKRVQDTKVKDLEKKPDATEMDDKGPTITFESDGFIVNQGEESDQTVVKVTLVRSTNKGAASVSLLTSSPNGPQTATSPEGRPCCGAVPSDVHLKVDEAQDKSFLDNQGANWDQASPSPQSGNVSLVQKVTFADEESSKTVEFNLSNELVQGKQFNLMLQDPSAGFRLDPDNSEILCNVSNDPDGGFPGMLSFEEESYSFDEGCGNAVVTVVRKQGSSGKITCMWATKDGTALKDSDYKESSGEIVFEDGETRKELQIPVIDDTEYELTEHFFVEIFDASENVMFDPTTDGHADKSIVKVYITDNDDLRTWVDGLMPFLEFDRDALALGNAEYGQQFCDALTVEGGEDDDGNAEGPSCFDWTLHIFSVPWKLAFATVPPCRCCGGWLTFFISLTMIGGLTAIIGDLATLMGDAMGLNTDVTAITFVALGTSLPDTFASKKAATDDPTADAAIGNVTGSNAVNVFLGLGMPWLIAAIYWSDAFVSDSDKVAWLGKYCGSTPTEVDSALGACPSVGFAVPAGELGVSVGTFSGCAVICLCTLVVRRKVYGCELGGPNKGRYLTVAFFLSLWAIYIGVSVYQSYSQ